MLEKIAIPLVCTLVIVLLPARETPRVAAQVVSTDTPLAVDLPFDLCPADAGPLRIEQPFCQNGSCCKNGQCRRNPTTPRVPDLAPSRPQVEAPKSGRERSIVTKRRVFSTCATRMHKRGFFARLRARRR